MKFPFYARVAFVLHALALTLLFMYLGKSIFIPLFFSFLIAILLHPLVNRLEKMSIPRSLASVIALLLFIVLIAGLTYFFSSQLVRLSKDLPQLEAKIANKVQDLQHWISDKYHVDNTRQSDYISKSANGIISTTVNSAAAIFLGIAESFLLVIFFLIFTFFILCYRGLLVKFLLTLFSKDHNERVSGVILQIRSVINNYIVGLLIEMLILGFLIFGTLMILGIKYALLISVFAAVLNVIPYIGIYTSAAIAILITLANGSGSQAVEVVVVFLVVHFIDANIVLPRVVGGRVKMNPFITIIAVLIGHLLWGIPGMFLFIPLTAIIRLISEEVDDMKAWAILLGEEKPVLKKKRLL